jgi:hypothetical protein
VLILKEVKVICFDTLLQVLILKVVSVDSEQWGVVETAIAVPPTPGVLEKEAASCWKQRTGVAKREGRGCKRLKGRDLGLE